MQQRIDRVNRKKMGWISNPSILIITLNEVYGLNTPIKRQRLSYIKTQNTSVLQFINSLKVKDNKDTMKY